MCTIKADSRACMICPRFADTIASQAYCLILVLQLHNAGCCPASYQAPSAVLVVLVVLVQVVLADISEACVMFRQGMCDSRP